MTLFKTTPGRMYVRNNAGEMVFDTDEGLFVVTDTATGTVVIPARSGIYNPSGTMVIIDVNTNHNINTTINEAADTVRGTFSVTVGSQGAIGNQGKYNAGGSYMHYCQGQQQETASWNHYWPGVMCQYTFTAGGGSLDLNEQTFIRPPVKPFVPVTHTTTVLSSTLSFDLIIGTFV